ncbi:MAG: hypothetical protein L3K10_02820 [Thermoplasmata archaeon]|nr:hypothetical protein [Thermoplasmata archaeon]
MVADPPWEWVEGDALRSSQFAFLMGGILGVGSVVTGLVVLTLLGSVGVLRQTLIPVWQANLLLLGILGPELSCLYLFPRWFPVVASLGISPVGLRLRMGFVLHQYTVKWRSVRRIGPDWIQIGPGLGDQRFKLTKHQADRLARFLRPGQI